MVNIESRWKICTLQNQMSEFAAMVSCAATLSFLPSSLAHKLGFGTHHLIGGIDIHGII